MTDTTSEKLNTTAVGCGWSASRLRANEGRYAVDYFAHTQRTLLKVIYDTRGRILEATFYDGTRRLGVAKHVGSRDTDKVKTVLSWIQSRSK